MSPEAKENIPQLPYTPPAEEIRTTPFTPFIPMLPVNLERRTILSDIVENSYEGSSNMPSGELSDRKYK